MSKKEQVLLERTVELLEARVVLLEDTLVDFISQMKEGASATYMYTRLNNIGNEYFNKKQKLLKELGDG